MIIIFLILKIFIFQVLEQVKTLLKIIVHILVCLIMICLVIILRSVSKIFNTWNVLSNNLLTLNEYEVIYTNNLSILNLFIYLFSFFSLVFFPKFF